MRRGAIAVALLTAAASPCSAQASRDTVVTVQGFLQAGDSGRWSLLLPRRVTLSSAAPEGASLAIEHLRELEPPGTQRATVQLSFSQLAVVTLAVIPTVSRGAPALASRRACSPC